MAEAHDPQNPSDSDDELKQGLLRRVAIAGVLVVVLLGGLALFDALNAPSTDKPLQKLAVAPPPDSVPKPAEPEAATAEDKPSEAATPEPEKAEQAIALPERTAAPTGSERPPTLPAKARPASVRPSEPILEFQRPDAAAELTKAVPGARIKHAPASRPLTQAAERSRQYVLQMGVFNSVANAEELRAKLELAGVPAQIEARVQVGPFSSRQEAESAREKLRGLGMEGGFLTALRK